MSHGWSRRIYGAGRALRFYGNDGQILQTRLVPAPKSGFNWEDESILAELRLCNSGSVFCNPSNAVFLGDQPEGAWKFVRAVHRGRLPRRTFPSLEHACDFYDRFLCLNRDFEEVECQGSESTSR